MTSSPHPTPPTAADRLLGGLIRLASVGAHGAFGFDALGSPIRNPALNDVLGLIDTITPQAMHGYSAFFDGTLPHTVMLDAIASLCGEGEKVLPDTVAQRIFTLRQDLNYLGVQSAIEQTYRIGPYTTRDVRASIDQANSDGERHQWKQRLIDATRAIDDMRDATPAELAAAITNMLAPGGDAALTPVRRLGIDVYDEVIAEYGRGAPPMLPFSLKALNDDIGGCRLGDTTVLMATPGAGKSAFGLDMARASIHHRGPNEEVYGVLIISNEMTEEDSMTRMLCAQGRVKALDFRDRKLTDDDMRRIIMAGNIIKEHPEQVVFINASGMLIDQVCSIVRQQCQRWLRCGITPGLFVMDYLQRAPNPRGVQSKVDGIAANSTALTELAKEQRMHGLILVQMNREGAAAEQADLQHIDGSSQPGKDAANVIALTRPEMRDPVDRPGEALFKVLKVRHGSRYGVGHVAGASAQLHYARFEDLGGGEAPPPGPPEVLPPRLHAVPDRSDAPVPAGVDTPPAGGWVPPLG